MSDQCNNGFWDLPPEERAARKEAACDRFDTPDFYDLSPEERGYAYGNGECDDRGCSI